MGSQTYLDPQVQEAIKAALEGNWVEALRLNQRLLEKYPNDVDTLNRLARSFGETDEIGQAKKIYHKVLELDPYNPIAEKNIKRLQSIKKGSLKATQKLSVVKGDIFLEEPGKTITVVLEDTAMPSILAGLDTGDPVKLVPHRNKITVVTDNDNQQRIGSIDDVLARRIAGDSRSGSKFEAFVKSMSFKTPDAKKDNAQVAIFVRETYRSPKVATTPFPSEASSFTPYVREEALNLLSNQAPLPTEADDAIEEVEVSDLPSANRDESLEDLAEKEQSEAEDDLED